MPKDNQGHDFDFLGAIQEQHLAQWEGRLNPALYRAVAEYVVATNKPAADESDRHRVYRGQDIVQIIMDWPDLKPCYAPKPRAGEDLI